LLCVLYLSWQINIVKSIGWPWRLELKPSSESAPTAGTYGGYWDVAAALSCLGKGPGRPVSCKIFIVSFVFGPVCLAFFFLYSL